MLDGREGVVSTASFSLRYVQSPVRSPVSALDGLRARLRPRRGSGYSIHSVRFALRAAFGPIHRPDLMEGRSCFHSPSRLIGCCEMAADGLLFCRRTRVWRRPTRRGCSTAPRAKSLRLGEPAPLSRSVRFGRFDVWGWGRRRVVGWLRCGEQRADIRSCRREMAVV